MKKESIIIGITLLILTLSSVIIFIEAKSYTPIDKDETKIVQPIDEERLNDSAKFQYWQKQTGKEIVNQDILKRGILKVLDLENTRFEKTSRRAICEMTYCESTTNDVHGALSGAKAETFDLNNDKKDEIIGYSYAYCKSSECKLYILKKEQGEYIDISWVESIDITTPIAILNHKTNGYHDIVIFNSKSPDSPRLRRYGMELSEYDDIIDVSKEEWLKYLKKAK